MLGNGTDVAPEDRHAHRVLGVDGAGWPDDVADVGIGRTRICAAHTDGTVSCWGMTFA